MTLINLWQGGGLNKKIQEATKSEKLVMFPQCPTNKSGLAVNTEQMSIFLKQFG